MLAYKSCQIAFSGTLISAVFGLKAPQRSESRLLVASLDMAVKSEQMIGIFSLSCLTADGFMAGRVTSHLIY